MWFKRKRYGWGWYPASWQGWLITLFALAAVFCVAYYMPVEEDPWRFFGFMTLIVGLLIVICYRTGEKPEWQWG